MVIFSLGHGLSYWRNVLSERDVHHLHGVLPDDDSFISAVNCKLMEAVLFIFRVHLPMRRRKKKAEEQAYKNAKDAILGWKNDSAFRGAVCVNLMHYFSFKVCCLELLYKLIKWFISFLDGPFVSWLKRNFGSTGVTPPCAGGMQLGETFHGFPTHAAPFPLPLVQPGSLCLQHPPTLSVVGTSSSCSCLMVHHVQSSQADRFIQPLFGYLVLVLQIIGG